MAKIREPDMYACKCGFEASTALGFHRHQRTAGKADEHRLVTGNSKIARDGVLPPSNRLRNRAGSQTVNQAEDAHPSQALAASHSTSRMFSGKGVQDLRASQPDLSQELQEELEHVLQPLRAVSQPNVAAALQLDMQQLLQQPPQVQARGGCTPPPISVEGLPTDTDELLNLLMSTSTPVLPTIATATPGGVHASWASVPSSTPDGSGAEDLLRCISSLPPVAPEPWEGANAPMPSGEAIRVSSLRRQALPSAGSRWDAHGSHAEGDVLQPPPLMGVPTLRCPRPGSVQDGCSTSPSSHSASGQHMSPSVSPRRRHPTLTPPVATTSPSLSRQPSSNFSSSHAPATPGGRLGSVLAWAAARASRQWDSTRASLAPYLPHVSDEQVVQLQEQPEQLARQVEAVLAWRDPWLSTRVLVAGLYLLICARHFFGGSNLLQPITALCAMTLLFMLYTHLTHILRPFLCITASATNTAPLQRFPADTTAELQRAIAASILRTCSILVPYIAACLALAHRAITTHRLAPAVSIVSALWIVMLLGEMDALSQWSLMLMLYAGVMTLPLAYTQSQRLVEGVVEEGFRAVTHLLAAATRASLGASGAVLFATITWTPVSVVVRVPVALVLALAVLVWCTGRSRFPAAIERRLPLGGGSGPRAGPLAGSTTGRERRVLRGRP